MARRLATKGAQTKLLAFYKTLPLKQLRRRQDICRAQIATAFEKKLDGALEDLQTMESLLARAVDYVAFDKPSAGRPAARKACRRRQAE